MKSLLRALQQIMFPIH